MNIKAILCALLACVSIAGAQQSSSFPTTTTVAPTDFVPYLSFSAPGTYANKKVTWANVFSSSQLVTLNGIETLSNKTLNAPLFINSAQFQAGGTLITLGNLQGTPTGGIWDLSNMTLTLPPSLSLVTPNLGTPSAINLTHGTALPLATGVSGLLPIANGGTGASNASNGIANLLTGTMSGTPTGGTLSFANLTFTLPASMTITTPTITNPTFSFGSNGSMTWTAGNGTGTELREVWAAITNTGGNVLGLRNNASANALATIKGADASGGETFALGSGTNLSSGPLGTTNCVFWESNRIDGAPTSSAYPIFILFTGTCGGTIPFGQYVREQWLADGSWAMNDRLGVGSLALNAGGTTLQIGNHTDGGNVASVSAHSNIVMANNTGITLDATSRVSVTNPGIEFGVSGPNMYAPGGGGLSIASGLTTGRADAITIDPSQNVTFHAGTIFSTGPTVPSITISAAGLTYLIMKNTTVGSNAQWNEYMDGGGNRVFDYYNGSAYVSPSPMVIGPTGTLNANHGLAVTGVFHLTPQATPGSPTEGDIYVNSTDHHTWEWNGTAWKQLDN